MTEQLDLPLPRATRDGLQEAALLARGVRLRAEADAVAVVQRARADADAIFARARVEAAEIIAGAERLAAALRPGSAPPPSP